MVIIIFLKPLEKLNSNLFTYLLLNGVIKLVINMHKGAWTHARPRRVGLYVNGPIEMWAWIVLIVKYNNGLKYLLNVDWHC